MAVPFTHNSTGLQILPPKSSQSWSVSREKVGKNNQAKSAKTSIVDVKGVNLFKTTKLVVDCSFHTACVQLAFQTFSDAEFMKGIKVEVGVDVTDLGTLIRL